MRNWVWNLTNVSLLMNREKKNGSSMLKTNLTTLAWGCFFLLKIWLVGAISGRWALSNISCTRSSLYRPQAARRSTKSLKITRGWPRSRLPCFFSSVLKAVVRLQLIWIRWWIMMWIVKKVRKVTMRIINDEYLSLQVWLRLLIAMVCKMFQMREQ